MDLPNLLPSNLHPPKVDGMRIWLLKIHYIQSPPLIHTKTIYFKPFQVQQYNGLRQVAKFQFIASQKYHFVPKSALTPPNSFESKWAGRGEGGWVILVEGKNGT